MQRIAKFEKVSIEQFISDWEDTFGPQSFSREIYEAIKLPQRATAGSAGYDFFSTLSFELKPNQTIKIPTGIRVKIDEGWVLQIYPRSGLGFKYRLNLDNTVGIIDSDYYNADNEGHIFIKITNDSRAEKNVIIDRGMAFAQGIFLQYGLAVDDCAEMVRTGGFGSTDKS